MLDKEVKLKTLGEQERNLLKNKSPFILPDNPSEKGFNANQIKRTMYEPILLLFDWLKKQGLETAEIIELIKNAFNNLETKVHDRGVALELDEANGIVKLIGKDEKGNNVVLSSIDLPFDTQINLINKYFTVNEEHDNVLMEYEYIINWLVVKEKADFEDGFYSSTKESGDTYSSGLSLNHNIDEFSMVGYDYNYTDGTHYTNRFTFETGGNVQVAINNPTAKFTYNDKEVATEQDVEYLEKKIRNLQSSAEGSTFVYEEDSNIAYQKDVPSGASPYAVLNKVGGMSYTNENLYQYNNYLAGRGLTITENKGVITLNGTPTESGNIRFDLKEPLTAGSYTLCFFYNSIVTDLVFGVRAVDGSYLYTGLTSTNGVYKYTTTKETASIFIGVNTSMTFNNFTFKPMLVKGSTAPTKFIPYFEGIRNSAVTEINSNGANIMNLNDTETTLNGVTYSIKGGVITLNGTNNLGDKFDMPLITLQDLENTNYSIGVQGMITTSYIWNLQIFSKDWSSFYQCNKGLNENGGNIPFVPKYMKVVVEKGATFNNHKIYLTLVKGSTIPTTFKLYKEPITKTLPSAVTTLTDYGLGINEEYYNYIDFERKVYVRKVGITSLNTDTYKWHPSPNISNNSFYYVGYYPDFTIRASSSTEQIPIIHTSKEFEYSTPQLGYQGKNCITVHTTGKLLIYFNKTDYPDMGTFENFSNWINEQNIQVVYPLPQIIEEDISYLFKDVDEFIEVEELGSIRFENEFEQDVPSTITYQVKI